MKRLTIRVDNGLDEIYFSNPDDPEGAYTIIDLADADMEKVANRLAEYEDSELAPEDIKQLVESKATEHENIELRKEIAGVNLKLHSERRHWENKVKNLEDEVKRLQHQIKIH